MKVAALVVVVGLGATALVAPSAQAEVGNFTAAGTSPSSVAAPGTVEARFAITGLAQDANLELAADPVRQGPSAFSGEASTVRVTGVKVEGGGTLTVRSIAMAALAPTCIRGATFTDEWTKYRLDVPANTTVTVVVSAEVPAGLPGRVAGVALSYGQLAPEGGVRTAQLLTLRQDIPRTGYVDGLSLKASARKAGKVSFSGRLIPASRGEKVTFVSRSAATQQGVDSVFGFAESALKPSAGLSTLGWTRTTKGGKFSTKLKVPKGVGVVAYTAGAHGGASCGVLVK